MRILAKKDILKMVMEMKNLNILYIFPPQWMPISPHYAIPSLMGQFVDSPHKLDVLDINLEFYCHILKRKYISDSLKKARELEKSLYEEIVGFYDRTKDFNTYTLPQKNKLAKHVMIKSFFAKYEKDASAIPVLIEDMVKMIREEKHFYNPKILAQILNIINIALDIASMPYYPSVLTIGSYHNQHLEMNWESIKYHVFDKETNMFIDFYREMLPKIKEKNPDSIGISINSYCQVVPGLTLANMLKKETDAHISIGGNYFTRLTDTIKNIPEFFELFCDTLLVKEGERPVIELTDYLAGNRKIEDVSNLMYLKGGKVVSNENKEPIKLDDMKPISLEGFNLKKYFMPEIVMPFQASRGCYWGKCSFCDHDFGMKYNIKNVDKLIEQLKYIKEKYGITKFEFIDEAISPKYLELMSEKILENNLDISFFCDARLESGFSKDILEKAKKAGLKMVLWGLESGSKKIMDLINKGVDFEDRMNVLRRAHEADIFNFAFIFFGFPAETKEDAKQTIDLICKNTDIINVYGKSVFSMGKHTKLRENPEFYGVKGNTYQEEEFSPTFRYEAVGMTKQELNEMVNLCEKECLAAYGKSLVFQLITRELLLLYLCKYGTSWVSNYKLG